MLVVAICADQLTVIAGGLFEIIARRTVAGQAFSECFLG